jgi:hypothetical protein
MTLYQSGRLKRKMQNLDKSYIEILDTLKQKIKTAQIKASLAVNAEMLLLYWEIGKAILDRQQLDISSDY